MMAIVSRISGINATPVFLDICHATYWKILTDDTIGTAISQDTYLVIRPTPNENSNKTASSWREGSESHLFQCGTIFHWINDGVASQHVGIGCQE